MNKVKAFFFAIMLLSLTVEGYAAQIYVSSASNTDPDWPIKKITIEGRINKGDVTKLHRVMRENPFDVISARFVALNSPGGNVLEAIKIAEELQKLFLIGTVYPEQECSSACFLIYAAMPQRTVMDGARLGLHRPYLDKEQYALLSQSEARSQTNALYLRVRNFLEMNQVPSGFIEKMFSISSDDIFFLSRADIEELGDRAPYADEMEIAQCGRGAKGSDSESGQKWLNCMMNLGRRESACFVRSVAMGSPAWRELQRQYADKGPFWKDDSGVCPSRYAWRALPRPKRERPALRWPLSS